MKVASHAQAVLGNERDGVTWHDCFRGGDIERGLERSLCKCVINTSVKILVVPSLEACLKPATPRPVDIAIQPVKPGAEHIAVCAGEVDLVLSIGLEERQAGLSPVPHPGLTTNFKIVRCDRLQGLVRLTDDRKEFKKCGNPKSLAVIEIHAGIGIEQISQPRSWVRSIESLIPNAGWSKGVLKIRNSSNILSWS